MCWNAATFSKAMLAEKTFLANLENIWSGVKAFSNANGRRWQERSTAWAKCWVYTMGLSHLPLPGKPSEGTKNFTWCVETFRGLLQARDDSGKENLPLSWWFLREARVQGLWRPLIPLAHTTDVSFPAADKAGPLPEAQSNIQPLVHWAVSTPCNSGCVSLKSSRVVASYVDWS